MRRNLEGNMLKGLQVSSAAQAESAQPVLTQGVSEAFKIPSGATHKIIDALAKAALLLLRKHWPGSLPFEELAVMTRASLRQAGATVADDDDRAFGDRLMQGYAVRAVELRVHPPRLALAVSARPVASPLARLQAEQGNLAVTNLRHEPVKLNELPRRMLPLLDGTRDIDAITVDIVKLAKNGKIGVRERDDGPVVTDDATLAKILRQAVEGSLPDMVTVALLLE